MNRSERITNIFLIILLPLAVGSVLWALYGFPIEKLGFGMLALSIVTIFFSSYLRIQLPRTKIHLTISDALVFFSFLVYGPQVAILLAALETAVTSLHLRRQGLSIKSKTILVNVSNSAFSAFITAIVVQIIFGPVDNVMLAGNTGFIWLLATMAISQFFVNTTGVAIIVAVKTQTSIWQVWNEYCLNAFVMYLSGALMAGLSVKALDQINVFLFAAVLGFFALVYLTFRRYNDDVKATGALAENAERQRAEQAEAHVKELEHYVGELQRSSEELRLSREKFRHAAYHDELTGLPNRNQFHECLQNSLEICRGHAGRRFAVLFLDLNRFKMLNESLGHSVGDQLIKRVGERLAASLGENDMVGRFSGDEFAILLGDIAGPGQVTEFAERIAAELSQPFGLSEQRQVFTSVSIGIAFGNPKYDEAEEILRDADIAMYYAKEKQKSFVIFDREMHAKAVSLLELETDLRFAVERDEFELYYQPIVNLDNVRLSGFEALVRWNHPQRGMVPPDEFISLAESTGLIIPMTVNILRAACRQLVEWQLQWPGNDSLVVSVNLSVKHLTHPGLVDQIELAIRETGIQPSHLKLEITESAIMENAEHAISVLKRIKSTGVKLSIDDFGTGYSSLSYLHRFPIDTLKIDRSFVSTMEEGTENGEIVRTVIALAKALKLSVIAEGIESIHQFHQLRILGCDLGQGYLFSRPLPAAGIAKLFADELRWQNILPVNEFGVVAQNGEYTQMRLPS